MPYINPNFAPWFPWFYKMAMVDRFVILTHVQFEKGGFQNRYKLSNNTWVTKPVDHGLDLLSQKTYTDGLKLVEHNMEFILWACDTLGIHTEIVYDVVTQSRGTQRLIDNLNHYGASIYVTNPDAKKKYLDEQMILDTGIDIEYCVVPKDLQIHLFEAFEKFGIEGTKNQLKRAKPCARSNSSLAS